jgi:uncharacterized repeat protein (TIGR02543 family)
MKRKILSLIICLALLASFLTFFSIPVLATPPASALIVNILHPDGTITLAHAYAGTPVYNNGVIVYYTYPELEAFAETSYYATIDAMPAAVGTRAYAVSIGDLVNDLNTNYSANISWASGQKIVLYPNDAPTSPYQGNNFYTYDFIQGQTRYYYPNLVEKYTAYRSSEDPADLIGWDADPAAVEPVLCLSSYQARYAIDADLHNNPTMDATDSFRFCLGLTPTEASDGIAGAYSSTNKFCRWTYRIDIGPVNGPSLTADATNNIQGQPIVITYTDKAAWRSAVSGVTVDSVTVDPSHYTLAAGNLTLDNTVFTSNGSHIVVVAATGFMNASVTQKIGVPPTLTTDSTNAVIGQAVDITFTDNTYWRAAVSGVTLNGNAITNYTLTAGNLHIPAADFTVSGNYTVLISAAGYTDTSVVQPMSPAPSCTVAFDSQGGSAVSSQSVAYGGLVTAPTPPTKTGYAFSGWYREAACTNAWNFASDTVTGNITLYAKWTIGFAYTTYGSTATITGYTGAGGAVVIPETFTWGGNTYTVTAIADGTSAKTSVFHPGKTTNTTITSVTIPDSMTTIGDFAFYQCTKLASVTMGNNVTVIGKDAFVKTALTSLDLPDNATLGEYAFYMCTGLTSLTIPQGVTLGQSVFCGCSGLTSLTLENGRTDLGIDTFEACTGLTSVTIPDSITAINNNIFNGCTGLVSITIPNNVTSIGNMAFKGCTGLTSLTLPNNLTAIGISAFRGCTGLTSMVIPNSVTSLEADVYSGCTSLSSVTLSNSLTTLATTTFIGCTGLTSINIPAGVTTVNANAFEGCTGLTSVTLPAGLTTLGDTVFSGCSNLAAAYFPGAKPTIGADVFTGTAGGFTLYYHVSQSGSWTGYTSYNAAPYCTLTLDPNYSGGSPTSSFVTVTNGHIAAPADPSRSHYTFSGWYKEAACTNAWNFSSDSVIGDTTLYAKWTPLGPVVIFNIGSAPVVIFTINCN